MNQATPQLDGTQPGATRPTPLYDINAGALRPVISEIDYHQAWRAFAVRHFLALFLVYTWIPVSVGLFLLSRLSIHRPIEALAGMLLWLIAAAVAIWWAGEFRCPRCRRRYGALGSKKGSSNLTRGIFDQVCNNCKLRKFEHG